MIIYFGAAALFLFFTGLAFISAKFLHLEGATWYFFVCLLGVLGLSAAAFWVYFQTKWQRKEGSDEGSAPGGGTDAGNADHLIRDANAKLAHSKGGAGIANLATIFVIGDRGTAKTSTILNSGLEAELLAGQVYQDNMVAPTRAANIFYARDTVFVEAGGALMANPSAWTQLVARLQPARLRSLIGGGGQAPRGVLLCFDLETFSRQGAADAVANAARYLQARLGEISQILGISFPVYVLFSRADRLPFFADFVRNLSLEEAGQVVGATLPIRSAQGSGVYAEEETQRLTAAFNQLFHSFCDQRLRILPRETDAQKIPSAYEFPREFRKLRGALVQVLVDVCRPSQLRASPFLRGFYFSGVRPVHVADVPAAAMATPAAPAETEMASGATRMFRVGVEAERRAQQAMAQASGGTRKVPQWLFLGHLFHDVILADDAARAASGSSVKTSGLKRVLAVSAAVLALFYSVMLMVSFFGNRALEQDALTAARGIAAGEAAGGNLPSEDALRRLDGLRRSAEQLSDYEYNGTPLSLRWGLYQGSAMLPNVRRIYYNKFRQLLFGSTQAGLLGFLRNTAPSPGPSDDYGYAYDTLKSYLLTTSEWKRSSDASLQAFLGSRLLARWSAGHESEIGKERMDLAKLQFDFYARDLHNGNPYPPDGNADAITRARIYLSKFSGAERVYQFLLAEADKRNPPTTFNKKFPGTSDYVTSSVEVRWAFTRDGWKFIHDQIQAQNFSGEKWVLGEFMGPGPDKASMEKGILDAYTRDYVDQWRAVLRRSNVNRYAGLQDASRKLGVLTGSGAPLLALLWWTSQNTSIEAAGVAEKFKAVQMVAPWSGAQVYIADPAKPYNASLLTLQQAVDRAANKEPDGDRAMRDNANSATLTTRQLGASFPPDPEGRIDQRTQELLLQPITYLDGLGSSDLRAAGAGFCTAFNGIARKFPFDSGAQTEVTLNELGDLLRPKTGRIWTFYESALKTVMQCQNGECTATNPQVSPAFVRFASQLMKFSRAVYGDAGTDPNLSYTLRPLPTDRIERFDITVNGEATHLKGGESHRYVWPGAGNSNFVLSLRLTGGSPLPVQNFTGTWALFHFFADADRPPAASGANTFGWVVRQGRGGQALMDYAFYADTGGGPAVFSKDFLSTLKCVVPVAR